MALFTAAGVLSVTALPAPALAAGRVPDSRPALAADGARQGRFVTMAAAAPATSDAVIVDVDSDLSRFAAIDRYTAATRALTAARLTAADAVGAAGRTVATSLTESARAADAERRAETAEQAAVDAAGAARAALDTELTRMSDLALGLYLHAGAAAGGESPDVADTAADRSIMLDLLLARQRELIRSDRQQVTATEHGVDVAHTGTQRAIAASARAEAAVLVAKSGQARAKAAADAEVARAAAAVTAARLAAIAPAVPTGVDPNGPPILGVPVLTADELASWFASSGHQGAASVPIPVLAGFYVAAGRGEGVRGDIAFAQSVIETGYFAFPAGGQLTGSDNNFAGIGACDSCSHGWSFPDAQTGVRAQLQLLHAYASTSPVRTPLVGPVGVTGCCPTWMSLTGVWATATTYGPAILALYLKMLDWALQARLAAAGL